MTISIFHAIESLARAEGGKPPFSKGDPWHSIYARCESPIERTLCLSLAHRLGLRALAGALEACIKAGLPDGARVLGQQWILGRRYRADFLLIHSYGGNIHRAAVIEADGRESHDGPEARSRDHARDVDIVNRGMTVIRLSGREIVGGDAWRRVECYLDGGDASAIAATVVERRQMHNPPDDPDELLWDAQRAERAERRRHGWQR